MDQYSVNNEGTRKRTLTVAIKGKERIVFYAGKRATKVGADKFKVEIEGEEIEICAWGNYFNGIYATIFDQKVEVLRKLAWYEYILAILTFAPGVMMGAVGGALGAIMAVFNIYAMRKIKNVAVRLVVGLAIAGAMSALFFVLLPSVLTA